ncbi:MAG: hypothetical protein VKQ33_10995 [Candidatus Sericytochromatia bacterium]|nr:hypothetical protein [Candidatus Sericytochromatia bacterium]
MKPIHLLATLALLAGCSLPAQMPTAGSAPAGSAPSAQGVIDLPVELALQQLRRPYALLDRDIVASASYDPSDIGKHIVAVTVQITSNGASQSGEVMVPTVATPAIFPDAVGLGGYSRWEIFPFPTGIASTNPPSLVIKGLKLGMLHRAIVRAYGDAVVPATVYDPSADPTATSRIRLSDEAESTTELDLTQGASLPTKAKLKLSLYPLEATLGLWYADPDTSVYQQDGADVQGGEWISADGLATITGSATEVADIDFVGTTTLPAGADDPAVATTLNTLNDAIVNCLTGTSDLGTALADERLPGGDKVLSIEIPLAQAGSYTCSTVPTYRFVERNSVLATNGGADDDTKRGYKLLTQIGNTTGYQVNLKNGVILSYIKYQ